MRDCNSRNNRIEQLGRGSDRIGLSHYDSQLAERSREPESRWRNPWCAGCGPAAGASNIAYRRRELIDCQFFRSEEHHHNMPDVFHPMHFIN